MISRQKFVGWLLIAAAAIYIMYFLRVRLFTEGPILEKKEWVQFVGSILLLMIGTANVRLAAMREQKDKGLPR